MNLQDMIDGYIEQKVEAALSMRLHTVAIKLSKSQEKLESRVDDLEDKVYTLESELDDAQREVSDLEESLESKVREAVGNLKVQLKMREV
jgi:predicted  nucleic acid-binding Zn-ribbon protein